MTTNKPAAPATSPIQDAADVDLPDLSTPFWVAKFNAVNVKTAPLNGT